MDKYIVVRGIQSVRGGGLKSASAQAAVSYETLSAKDAAEVRRDPDNEIAMSFPTALIAPLGKGESTGSAWGIVAVGADKTGATGANVRVAVLDTGIDKSHPAFAGVSIDDQDFTGTGNGDQNGHGTHCAGTIFGRDVAGTRIGVARGVTSALAGKVLDDKGRGTSEMIVQALQWAARERADVVSMSLGFDFGTMVDKLVNQQGMPIQAATSIALRAYRDNLRVFDAVMDLLAAQAQLGVNTVVVAAAGNESRRNCSPSYTVAASLPAAARGMLCVGAVGQASGNYGIGYFSNTFPTLVAPGVSILSAAVGGGLKAMDGTSMACPHAAGVAVLWSEALRLGGRKAPTELIIANMITSARKDVFTTAYDESEFGQGLVQAPA